MVPRVGLAAAVLLLVSTAGSWPAKPATVLKPATAGAAAVTGGGSWTTYHHDDAHTGYDPSAPTLGTVTPTPGWSQVVLDAEVYAEPLIYNGLVYVATLFASDDLYRVFGLDLATGAVQLQTVIPNTIGTGFDWTIQQERGALA